MVRTEGIELDLTTGCSRYLRNLSVPLSCHKVPMLDSELALEPDLVRGVLQVDGLAQVLHATEGLTLIASDVRITGNAFRTSASVPHT